LLHTLGVTDFKNLDNALDQVSKSFNGATAGQDKLHASVVLFGKRGGPDLISVLAKMPGGFAEAQREAEKLGITLSEDDVRAAKEFGKVYETVSRQVEIGVTKFALQYGPQITEELHIISEFLADNKDDWASWGSYIGNVFKGIAGGWRDLNKFLSESRAFGQSPFNTNVTGGGGMPSWWHALIPGLALTDTLAARGSQDPHSAAKWSMKPDVDYDAMFEKFAASARALQSWYDGGRRGPRPPGQLRPQVGPQQPADQGGQGVQPEWGLSPEGLPGGVQLAVHEPVVGESRQN